MKEIELKILNIDQKKTREEYILGNIKIEVDEYPGMNPYIELEGRTKKDIDDFLEKFDFPLKYTTKDTASEIIKKAGLDPDNLVFKKKSAK